MERPTHPRARFGRSALAPLVVVATLAALPLVAIGCGDDGDSSETSTAAETAAADSGPDLTALPLGDGKYSDSPKKGSIYSCQGEYQDDAAGAAVEGPWINQQQDTWNAKAKVAVPGQVEWPSEFAVSLQGDKRVITGNDLPSEASGEFPVPSDSEAYDYDSNPNSIAEQEIALELPANPTELAEPSCVGGEAGVLLDGVALFNGFDAGGRDAVANEVQDNCDGHPQVQGVYHYHSQSPCITDNDPGEGHSPLIGYALDGFGIYGHHGEDGEVLTNKDLDACHGHSHEIDWDGETVAMFHYHSTFEFPYTVSCFRGEPAATMVTSGGGGAPEGGGAGGGPPEGGPPAGAPPQ